MTDGIDALAELGAALQSAVPSRFTEFCVWLGVSLTPGQRAFCLVAYDGLEPCELGKEDREIARLLFGDVERIPKKARRDVTAVCGRGSGKSYVLLALRLLHLSLTVPLTTLAPGEIAAAVIVAPDKKTAQQTLRFAIGAAEQSPIISRMLDAVTTESLRIKRADGMVSIQVLAASVGGRAIRGRSYVGAVLEECAFFKDEATGVVNDAEIYRAISPRIMRGGQLIIASTPWAESGLIYESHQRNHGHPVDSISIHAPTLLLRDDAETRSMVELEHVKDPENAEREFGAKFMRSGAYQFFATAAIDAAMAAWEEVERDPDRNVVAAGGDFAFTRNSSALAITVRDADWYTVNEYQEKKPEGGALRPGDVVAEFADTMERWGTSEVMADGHYRQSIMEHLETRNMFMVLAPEGAGGKAETYVLARQLLHQGKVRLKPDERVRKQLKDVNGRPTAGGSLSIKAPEWKSGEHGDIVSAIVLSLWAASRMVVPEQQVKPAQGTPEWMEQREEERLRRWKEKYDREQGDDNAWILGPNQ